MAVSSTQIVLAIALAIALGFAWYVADRGRVRAALSDRFIYGVPWGTLVTVAIVLAFYLLVQSGARRWSEPLVYPFVSWSYFYPLGVLTSGIAHGSPGHLTSNLTGTIVLAPIAEYAWSHYRPSRRGDPVTDGGREASAPDGSDDAAEPPAPDTAGDAAESPAHDGAGDAAESVTSVAGAEEAAPSDPSGTDAGGDGDRPGNGDRPDGGWLDRPWIRAVVIFPGALLCAAVVTSAFSLGPALGFSGAVFALVGFALVSYPLTTVVAVVVTSALRILYQAFSQPVVTETLDPGGPAPPSWAGIAFQAHLLGFLLGVLAALALLHYRDRRPAIERLFFATLVVGLAQSLWLVTGGGGDSFTLYRGAGVSFVLLLTVVIALAVAGSDRPLPRPLSVLPWAPSRRTIALGWLVLVGLIVALGLVGAVLADVPTLTVATVVVLVGVLVALPAVVPVAPDRWLSGPISRRQSAVVGLAVLTLAVAVVAVPLGLLVVGGDAPGSGGVEVGDYTVTYESNVTVERSFGVGDWDSMESQHGGVLVVSDEREFITPELRSVELAHDGEATVVVGGVGWQETVGVERTGWAVVGNETAYAVDLEHDGETTRSYASDPVRADIRVDGATVEVVPTSQGFDLRVSSDDTVDGEGAIPDVNESTEIGGLTIETEDRDGDVRVVATVDETTVLVAEREEY